MDRLREADPEVVLFAPCGYPVDGAAAEARACLAKPEWAWLAGKAVWAMDANGLTSRPGPRVVDGIEAMACIFNPSCFSPIDPRHAVRVQ
jgi:iron complex transport system substrate-binding protein